ncbi:biopolymer transporter ExbD [Mannheimia granulomatis]|uniref:ExbD/TolR family protein n=1 Tax=Pasteurellaceae TaxID=712 RepID=UPI00036DB666|nr:MULTISPECIES: biopolymer transporter ExbD [Pasteurellaceae]QLB14963.1 biopolymer transporter ExbD [Mannheimia granulomatis]
MAFGNFDSSQESVMSEINVTPLVDVMLVLLIIFMITMPILTNSIPLELPTANVEKQAVQPSILQIAINQEGFYLNNQPIQIEQLAVRFEQAFTENQETVVAISADVAVEYRHIAKVLELAQNAGLKKIGFITQP